MRSILLVSAAAIGGVAGAGQAAAQDDEEEIVVTGSYIRGTPEDAALPVDVITEQDLIDRGSPTTLDLIKSLPSSSGVLGDTNQFDSRAQGSEGSGTVNLRGLGPQRTLVLLNGRRMVINPFAIAAAGAVDTNTIPAAAVGRIEVLKDGAAAIYGSDAVGGVVNFITRDVRGLEFAGNYEFIEGSDGDGDISAAWGWEGRQASLVLSAAYQHRSELPVLERDWAHRPIADNPQGGYSAAGSPNTYIELVTGRRVRDPECTALDGIAGFSGVTPVCQWQYTVYDNLTEEENRYQLFADFDVDLTDTLEFHMDALYAHTEVPEWHTSPSYALLQVPTSQPWGGVLGQYFVPGTNPGLINFIATHPGNVPSYTSAGVAVPGGTPSANFAAGVLYVAGRPFALGGNPLFDYGAVTSQREYEAGRFSAGLAGEFSNAISWDLALTYGEEEGYREGRDTVVNRFQRALRGLGGPNCPTIGGTPGVGGCLWFNPFASSIPANAITGTVNPGYNGALASNEDPDLINWFFPVVWTRDTSSLFVADLVFSGESSITLPGGAVAWAFGGQHRQEGYERELDDLSNLALNPCIDSPDFNLHGCAVQTGALGFLGSSRETTLSRDINALFAELSLPVTDTFEMQIAARYEDYGGETGSTFDPKVSARWQLTDWLALRGSAGSTFRGPALTSTTTSFITSLQNVLGTFRAIDIFSNPDLEPESADTLNVGAIVDTGGLFATVDYWSFDFENPIVTEPLAGMVASLFPNGATGANNCADPAFAGLLARFTFTSPCIVNSAGTISRVRTNYINGPAVQTSGIDFQIQNDFDGVLGGRLTLGVGGTYVLEYQVGATTVEGLVVAGAFDGVGQLNYQTQIYPVPQWRGSAFAEWNTENQNLRLAMNYVDGYLDQRNEIVGAGKQIDSYTTWDVNYRLNLLSNTTFLFGVQNITDEDPPFARLDLNYDPFVGNPVGRSIRVGLRQTFN